MTTDSARLKSLEGALADYGGDAAERKRTLLAALDAGPLTSARQVERLHETLCFLRAYPDDAALLSQVERMLERFARRRDLRRHRSQLIDTGIAGTDIHYSFFAPTARWIARRFGEAFEVDWRGFRGKARLKAWLEPLILAAEIPGFYEAKLDARGWIERLKARGETDAAFLVRAVDALPADAPVRQRIFEDLGLDFRIRGATDGPSRTRARYAPSKVWFQTTPLRRARPDLAQAVRTPPRSVRSVTPREGAKLIELAREAMITRDRDLDSFASGDPRDVRIVDCEGGLEFVCIGLPPEQRLVLEAVYAFLTLKNGVPIGYVLCSALFGSSEIAYNVFDTYRGGEAGYVYGRVLGMVRALFGSDTFTIYPYQLGHKNAEGIASGAWWFYQKLGFRSRDAGVLRLMKSELTAMRRDPKHRSTRATLRKLARENVYWSLGRERDDVIGVFPGKEISLRVTDYVAARFGGERRRGERTMAAEAAARLRVPGWRGWPAGERLAFARWSPLVLLLDGIERWSSANRRALVRVIRAKGGRRESRFVELFDAHVPLRRAILRLAK